MEIVSNYSADGIPRGIRTIYRNMCTADGIMAARKTAI
jgi:hypothetical protein